MLNAFSLPMIVALGALVLGVAGLWHRRLSSSSVWLFIIALFLIPESMVSWVGKLGVLLLMLLTFAYYRISRATEVDKETFWHRPWVYLILRPISFFLILLLSLALAIHQWPGFQPIPIFTDLTLSEDSLPYSLAFHFDKLFVGLALATFGFSLWQQPNDVKFVFRQTLIITLLGTCVVLLLSQVLGFTRIDFKLPDWFLLWFIKMVFITCLAEEAFFRGFIQRELQVIFSRFVSSWQVAGYLGLLVASLLFGLAHFPGGIAYVFLATVAGLVYGFVFLKTQRLEAAVFAHCFLNTMHFVLLSYPALAP